MSDESKTETKTEEPKVETAPKTITTKGSAKGSRRKVVTKSVKEGPELPEPTHIALMNVRTEANGRQPHGTPVTCTPEEAEHLLSIDAVKPIG